MFSFAQPLFLLLLFPLGLMLAVWRAKRWQGSSRVLVLAVRSLMVLLLALALARPQLVTTFRGQDVVFLLDASRSTGGQDFSPWVNASLDNMGPDDRAAVLAFGRDARLLKPYSLARLPLAEPSVDDEFTDIEGALRVAMGLLPAGGNGRIVLISDGLENIGDSLSLASLLAVAGVPVDVLPVAVTLGPEVAVTDIAIPRTTWPGQQVVVEVEVESTVDTEGQLTLLWGGNVAYSSQFRLDSGRQRFALPVAVAGQGMQRVRATIEPQHDTMPQNNSIDGLTFVQAPPRVLVVEGAPGRGSAIEQALAAAGVECQRLTLDRLSPSLNVLAAYRAIFLVDVPAYRLTEEQLTALETFVHILGNGVVAVGGKNSFGLGLYQDTALERMLPVTMEVEQQEELPGLDLVLVIDRSGSMQGEKLNMAKNAALRSLDLLKDRDRLAVITFDTQYRVEAPLTPVSQRSQLEDAITAIDIGGGTIIYPALERAAAMLADSPRSRHIILLSDGVEGAQYNYDQLLEEMAAQNISLSTIALGYDADTGHMEYLANQGGGRFYDVPDSNLLPEVFVQETVMAGGDYLVEEDFVPSVLHPDAGHLAVDPPLLSGYVASSAKPLAEVLMETHRSHPLLSRWQYGLGRTMAFTSDSFGMWSSRLLAHPNFAGFWVDALNWVAPGPDSGHISLDVRLEGAGAEISALVCQPLAEGESLQVVLVAPDNSSREIDLVPSGGNTYTARVAQVNQGVYLISARRLEEGVVTGQTVGGFAVPYPPEFRIPSQPGDQLLSALREVTGGRLLADPGDVFSRPPRPVTQAREITYWFVLAAVVLWPVDIAARRLGLALPPLKRAVKKRSQAPRPQPEADPALERLLQAKESGYRKKHR